MPTESLPDTAAPLVCARGISVRKGGRLILDSIDLEIDAGQIVTLIGPNGAGKTTLVRVVVGVEKPDAGHITRRPGLRVGYAPQRFDLDPAMPLTVGRFLLLGGRADMSRVRKVLEEVGTAHLRDQQITRLSGGEFQRVVLARALLRDPELLVLDEPVRGVDFAGEAELYALIARIRSDRGLGVLLVSHDLHVVMGQSDRVLCLNRHLCCSGVPETVLQHPDYIRLFGREGLGTHAIYQHQHDHRHALDGAPHREP